ncbi:hypothetical protein BDA96_09G269200 [Sorghum bicolor]|uniref:Uncharacterized protein n=1 Tax=Sorghum bicolor TaxID=4558 RepID=A0A921U5X2_SORBI|nr:hypothetical protein BDA96_09G269200 [Sorghum bicolor]
MYINNPLSVDPPFFLRATTEINGGGGGATEVERLLYV